MTNSKKVLVVEDEKALNDAYIKVLSSAGYNTSGALDAKDGLSQLEELNPDAVLLDLNMPDMTGIDFLREAKMSEKYPETKVIVFSTVEDPDLIDSAYSLGASRYVLKQMLSPFDLESIVKEVLEN